MVHCAPKELSAVETVMLATVSETGGDPEPIIIIIIIIIIIRRRRRRRRRRYRYSAQPGI